MLSRSLSFKTLILRATTLVLLAGIGVPLSGCVYWNTMYNAKKHFKEAEKQNNPEVGGTKMTANRRLYEDAIAKAAKVVQKHPKSKYHDDALYLIGVSYFRIDNYAKSESAFRELLAVHPKSDFVEESQLYLARCRMQSGDEQAAYRTFSDLASTARKPEWRAEATFQRGIYLSEIGSYDSAVTALQQILDEYPDTDRANEARVLAADQLRRLNRPTEAMALYLPLIEHEEPLVRYPALIGLGGASYEAGQVDSGIAIFTAMAEDEVYADSIGNIRLLLGDGLERRGDVDGAWRQYEQVVAALEQTRWSAEAYFNMAEIKQYQQNDLASAKEFYDKVREEYASGKLSNEALTRSANISKLEQFRKSLGRGDLSRGAVGDRTATYDPEDLHRLERSLLSSPVEARPFDFVHSAVREKLRQDSLALAGPPSLDDSVSAVAGPTALLGPETPEHLKNPWDNPRLQGPETPPELMYSSFYSSAQPVEAIKNDDSGSVSSVAVAEVFGPPVDSLQLILNARALELLSQDFWERAVGGDSRYGPPSPASLYDFGIGDVYGPATPDDRLFARAEAPKIDSTTIRERETRTAQRKERQSAFAEIELAAETQMQLAELYRFDLDYPDSALVEYNELAERYKGTPYGAQALLAAADVYTTEFNDSTAAREHLVRILAEYAYTDYAGVAIKRLGWSGTDADTAHPSAEYRKAEDLYLVDNDPAGAIDRFRGFIEKYPYSRLIPRAEYAIAFLTDRYFPTGDSAVVWAYQEIAATYAQSDLALAATERLSTTVKRPKPRSAPAPAKEEKGTLAQNRGGDAAPDSGDAESQALPRAPRPKFLGQVVFPSADIGVITKEVVVVYKILIDFSGNVAEHELIQKSTSRDLDEATRRAIQETKFNPDSIAPESLMMWYRYEMRVTPPAPDPSVLDWYNRTGGIPNVPPGQQPVVPPGRP